MIKIEHLHHHLAGQAILTDINIEMPAQKLIALVGPNGAGKSTLFSLMARLNSTQQGNIEIGGHKVSDKHSAQLAKVVSMLSQTNHIQGRLRVKELLMFGRYPHHQGQPSQTDIDIIERVMVDFELETMATRFLSTLSGGQRQRVLIAMIVCQDTPYLLLDEPLNNLDMYHASQMMRQFRTLVDRDGKTIIAVLHDINHAACYADHIVMMRAGQIVASGAPHELITPKRIKALFGVNVAVLHHQGRPIIVDDF